MLEAPSERSLPVEYLKKPSENGAKNKDGANQEVQNRSES
jgi:hypothetical protein